MVVRYYGRFGKTHGLQLFLGFGRWANCYGYGIEELCRRSKPMSVSFWISFVMAKPHILGLKTGQIIARVLYMSCLLSIWELGIQRT